VRGCRCWLRAKEACRTERGHTPRQRSLCELPRRYWIGFAAEKVINGQVVTALPAAASRASEQFMRAALLTEPRRSLVIAERPDPVPGPDDVLIEVRSCGVCRTDLHVVDGELPQPKLPLVAGHQIVGTVAARGERVQGFEVGTRVGVPWLAWTCGTCRYCRRGLENLCENALFTGYTRDGGFAERTVADARYCLRLPDGYGDAEAAPLLCAGLIGYRAYRMTGSAERLGFYGFGAAAHILIQVARAAGREVFAFTRPGDEAAQAFARQLGAVWAGGSDEQPPAALDAAVLFAPVGALVPQALRAVDRGGVVVAAGIHMSDIPSFPYRLLWEERAIRSVANLTREDGAEFMTYAAKTHIETVVEPYELADTEAALAALREGRIQGLAVVVVRA
jgi:propanol-preferring alcohol dehydrogenase